MNLIYLSRILVGNPRVGNKVDMERKGSKRRVTVSYIINVTMKVY